MANLKHITAGIIAICFALAFEGIVNHVTGSSTTDTDINNDTHDELDPKHRIQTPNYPDAITMPPYFEIVDALIQRLEDSYLSAGTTVSFRYITDGFEMWLSNTPGVVVVTEKTPGTYEMSCPNTSRKPRTYTADDGDYFSTDIKQRLQTGAFLCIVTATDDLEIRQRIQSRRVRTD